MNFFGSLMRFFKSLFTPQTSENKLKNDLKDIETRLKEYNPPVYKSGLVLPVFAEALHTLLLHGNHFSELFQETIASEDTKIKHKAIDTILNTGFSPENRELYVSLLLQNRKTAIENAPDIQKEKDIQRKNFDTLMQSISGSAFTLLEESIGKLEKFAEVCNFPYIPVLSKFDSGYIPNNPHYIPSFKELSAIELVNMLMDFYFVSYGVEINKNTAQLILILLTEKKEKALTTEEVDKELEHLKKIAHALKKQINSNLISLLLKGIKKDPFFIPPTSESKFLYIKEYKERFQNQYIANTQRIDTDMQNEKLHENINLLFHNRPLDEFEYYNDEANRLLEKVQLKSLIWVIPLNVIKTFIKVYYTITVEEVLITLVTEGYFASPETQSTFSSVVFACNDIKTRLNQFEESFADGKPYSMAILRQYAGSNKKINTSEKDIIKYIDTINKEAKDFIQAEVTNLSNLLIKLADIIHDKKKASPEIIINIKFLVTTAKTKENFENIEKQQAMLEKFIEIMKNYAIIGTVEKK